MEEKKADQTRSETDGSDAGAQDAKDSSRLVFDIADKLPRLANQKSFTPEVIASVLMSMANGSGEVEAVKAHNLDWGSWYGIKVYYSSNKHFVAALNYARESWAACWEHKLVEVGKDRSRDVIENVEERTLKDGTVVRKVTKTSDNTAVNRDKLLSDNVKWLLAKKVAQIYGDKQQIDVKGSIDVTPIIQISAKDSPKLKRAEKIRANKIDKLGELVHESNSSSEVKNNNVIEVEAKPAGKRKRKRSDSE